MLLFKDLQKKINQIYADAQSVDFDQYSESETSNRSRGSGNSTSSSSGNSISSPSGNSTSGNSPSGNSTSGNSPSGNSSSSTDSSLDEKRSHFRQVFNSNKGEGIVRIKNLSKMAPFFI